MAPSAENFTNKMVALSFSLAILALLAVSAICYTSLNNLEETNRWVSHTYEVTENLEKIYSDASEMDRDSKNYLLTRQSWYVQSFESLHQVLLHDLDATAKMAQDNPVQKDNFAALNTQIREEIDNSLASLDLAKKGLWTKTLDRTRTNTEKETMTSVWKRISDMKLEEYHLLQKRKDAQEKNSKLILLIVSAGGLATILFCGTAAFFVTHQVKERQTAASLLFSSEKRFHSLSEIANDSFITVDSRGVIVEFNPVTETMFGYLPGELLGKPLETLMPKNFTERNPEEAFAEFIRMTDSALGITSVELLGKRKDGNEFPLEISTYKWLMKRETFYTIFSRDITERKFFTKMLLKNEHRLFQFLEAVPVGILVFDHEGKPYYMNQAAKIILGQSSNQVSLAFHRPDTGDLYPAEELPVRRALRGEKCQIDDIEIRLGERKIPLQIWSAPILEDSGSAKYALMAFLDITDRKQMIHSLREREEFFRNLFEESPIGMVLTSPKHIILNVNQAFCNMVGYSKSELVGKTTPLVTHPEDVTLDASLTKKLFDRVIPRYQIEKRYLTKKNSVMWCKISASLILDNNDKPLFRLSIVENITEQKETEIALKQSEDKFRRVFSESSLGMLFARPDGFILETNKAFSEMLEYAPSEVVGNNLYRLTHPEDIPLSRSIPEGIPGEKLPKVEKRYLAKSGKIVWGSVTPLLMKDPNDHSPFVLSVVENITERKIAEEAAKESEEKFRVLAENANEGIVSSDSDGTIVYFNRAAQELLGYSKEEALGRPFTMLVPEGSRRGLLEQLELFKQTGQSPLVGRTTEMTGQKKSGAHYPAEVSIFSWQTSKGVFLSGIFRDITERKQIEDMKRDLISVVSHQLKTPVAEINGYIENMLEGLTGDLSEKQKEYLTDMRDIGAENYRLISDLLNLSKIERGVITVEPEPISLTQLVELAIRDYEARIKKKGLQFILEHPEGDFRVLADPGKTVETLRNIINNALKCTDKGRIEIRTRKEEAFGVVEIKDTGIGMDSGILSRLFTKDRIMGSEAGRSGAGLGLFIAKSFMTLQKGDIRVESVLGKGSSFFVKIPVVKEEAS